MSGNKTTRGYFGVGTEGTSKAMNVGSIVRSAHAFGASFAFTVAGIYERRGQAKADTSDAPAHLPFYAFPDINSMVLPEGCRIVGVELTDEAVDLPSFHHPQQVVYILGPERGSLSAEMVEKCDFVIKIPTAFCVNVGIAAAIVMYDRVQSLGKFARRPARPGGPVEELDQHVHGGPIIRNKMKKFKEIPPTRLASDPD